MSLLSAVSNLMLKALYNLLSGAPAKPKTISTFMGSIQPRMLQLCARCTQISINVSVLYTNSYAAYTGAQTGVNELAQSPIRRTGFF